MPDANRGRPSGAREVIAAVLLAVLSVSATGAAVEAVLRGIDYRPYHARRAARLFDAVGGTLLDCYPSNPRGYFDIDLRAPEAQARYHHLAAKRRLEAVASRAPYAVECRYNALGLRDRPLGPRVAGVRRVVLIGDSFTEGQGVREPDIYAHGLERALNAAGTTRWEVRNCAARGADFPRLYDTFAEVIPYGADVVVYAMVLNDPFQSPAFASRQGYLNDWVRRQGRRTGTDDQASTGGSRLWSFVHERLENRRVSEESVRFYRSLYDTPNRDGWQRTQEAIRAMAESTRAQQGVFVVALWPWLVDLERGYPFEAAHESIRRFCAEAGIPFHDLRTALAGRSAESLWVHPVDWHPNDVAHRVVGLALAPVVDELARQVPLQSPGRRVPIDSGGVS